MNLTKYRTDFAGVSPATSPVSQEACLRQQISARQTADPAGREVGGVDLTLDVATERREGIREPAEEPRRNAPDGTLALPHADRRPPALLENRARRLRLDERA